MLGMNLSIFGQGEVPLWAFLILVVFFGLLTYLPICLPTVDEQELGSAGLRIALHGALFLLDPGFLPSLYP